MMPPSLHGTCLDADGFGVLITGKSGAGKSDLALRLLQAGLEPHFSLVADDRVVVQRQGDELIARAPEALAGLLEIRGIGIVRMDFKAQTRLSLIVRLMADEQIERLPHFPRQMTGLSGLQVPVLDLCAWGCSATHKLRAAMQVLRGQLRLATDGPDAV